MKKTGSLRSKSVSKYRVWLLGIVLGWPAWFSAQAAFYTIDYGVGTAPYDYRPVPVDYEVEATGLQNSEGTHGFVLHHNGTDTYVDMPGENYYITFLQVNNLGQVSGTFNANYGGYGCTSFFWDQGQLNLFSGGISDPHVEDMNDLGQVVGTFGSPSRRAFIWYQGSCATFDITEYLRHFQYNGTTYDLVNGESTRVDAINDSGQLLGSFTPMYQSTQFWFIATPSSFIPEPGTLSLFGLGMAALLKFRRRAEQL